MTLLDSPPISSDAKLIAALEGDRAERALEQAFSQLARGASVPLVQAMIKAFVRAGLAGLALRLLHSLRGAVAAHPQFALLSERLAGVPSGEWPRERCLEKLRKNAAILLQSYPELDPPVSAAMCDEMRWSIFESASGNRHVLRSDGASALQFVFPFADHRAHAAAVSLPVDSLSASYLLVGVPSHALWERLITVKSPGGYKPPIDIIETDVDVLAAWLTVVDFDAPLSRDRVSFFVGDDAVEGYRQFLFHHPWRDPPTHCTTNFRPGWKPPAIDQAFHSAIRSARADRQHKAKAVLDARYAGKNPAYWRGRLRDALQPHASIPLRIVGFTNRYSTVIQHAMRGLAAAFQRRGCRFELITQPNTSCAAIDVAGELLRDPCDLIVVLNHLRSEYAAAMPASVPYVCWIQDYMEPLWSKNAGRSVGALDLVIGHAPQFMAELFDYPVERFIASSNLTDTSTYSCDAIANADRERFMCDVSYISHASGTVESLIHEIGRGSPPAFRNLLERARELMVEQLQGKGWLHSTDLVRVMLYAERESGHPALTPQVRRTRVYPQITRLYDRIFRHQALEWAAEWARTRKRAFKLYGRGWDQHPTLKEFACGEIENGYPLRCVCQASAINLQVNGYASLHQRLLDAIASGGFVLSRYNPADFIRPVFVALKQAIESSGLRSVKEIEAQRSLDAHFDSQCQIVERLTGIRIADLHDAQRAEHCRIVRDSNGVADWLTDEGLFNAITSMKLVPARVACDVPGFEPTTFKSRDELHALLDHFADAPSERESAALPMRESVLKHDTYDGLAAKILAHFADGNGA